MENFWHLGKLVAEERWLVTRGDRYRMFDCASYKARSFFISSNCFLPENHDVTYYELPSIYGHDTFLLDVVAVGAAVKVGHVVLKPIRDGGRGVFFENKSSYLSEADIFLCARFFRATSRQI